MFTYVTIRMMVSLRDNVTEATAIITAHQAVGIFNGERVLLNGPSFNEEGIKSLMCCPLL